MPSSSSSSKLTSGQALGPSSSVSVQRAAAASKGKQKGHSHEVIEISDDEDDANEPLQDILPRPSSSSLLTKRRADQAVGPKVQQSAKIARREAPDSDSDSDPLPELSEVFPLVKCLAAPPSQKRDTCTDHDSDSSDLPDIWPSRPTNVQHAPQTTGSSLQTSRKGKERAVEEEEEFVEDDEDAEKTKIGDFKKKKEENDKKQKKENHKKRKTENLIIVDENYEFFEDEEKEEEEKEEEEKTRKPKNEESDEEYELDDEEKDEDHAVSLAGPSSQAFTAYSDRSRQNAARRHFRKSDEGKEKLARERSEKIAAQKEDLKDLVNKMKADGLNIRNTASKLSISDSLSDRQVKALLLNFLNIVRRGESSCRYPLTFASPAVFYIFQVKYTAPTLLAMAREGKLFEPRAFPDALEREMVEMEEMEEKIIKENGEEPEDDRVVFKFYTRCTPLRKIKQLLEQLDELERQYPVEHAWVVAQKEDLARLEKTGSSMARIFYNGTTIFSCLGRELDDDASSDEYSLLKHWKTVTGDQLEVYHWKHLDVPAETRFAWRTDESISGVEECLVDAAGGPALTLNQHPGGFVARIKPHPSLLPLYATLPQLRLDHTIKATLDRPRSSLAPVLCKEARTSRISNMLDALLRYVDKYPRVFRKPVARGDFLKAVKRMATKFELEGDNAVRAIIRKDIPHEALTVHGKMYDEGEVGRGSRTDRMLDEEVQGCISFLTGSRTATYTDKRFPMLDLWCITIDHPDGWILVQVIVLVIWIHIIKPRYVVIGAAKILNLCYRSFFSNIFIEDIAALQLVLDGAFQSVGQEIDQQFLHAILRDPSIVPTPDPVDLNQLLIIIIILIWREMSLPDYIDYVGTYVVVRIGVRFVVTVAVYDGGSHAYIGIMRPFTLRLAQACQMMIHTLETVTSGLNVDGSEEQAKAILTAAEGLAKSSGIVDVLEKIRAEVKKISAAYHSLKALGGVHRMDEETRERISTLHSEVMSTTMQAEDEKALKAIGAPGSSARLTQALEILDKNRKLINERNHVGIEPCPAGISTGPGSIEALLWMIFDVKEGSSFGRTARGATRSPQSDIEKMIDTTSRQLQRLKDARRKYEKQDASVVTVKDALEFTQLKGSFVRLIECHHCDWVELVKRNKTLEDRFRHACSKSVGAKVDLEEIESSLSNLKSANQVALKNARKNKNALSTVQRLVVWSADGEGAEWSLCASDPLVQSTIAGIRDGLLVVGEASKQKTDDRAIEKHGRLVIGQMKVPPLNTKMDHPALVKCLEDRVSKGLRMPSSFSADLLEDGEGSDHEELDDQADDMQA